MRRRLDKPRDWTRHAPLVIMLLGTILLLVFLVFGGQREISSFPASLEQAPLAWRPEASPFLLLAGFAPCIWALVAWWARGVLVEPRPAVIACLVLMLGGLVAAALHDRNGGTAIYPDRIVHHAPGFGQRVETFPISTVARVETGCSNRRGRWGVRSPSAIYNLVFRDGFRLSLSPREASDHGKSRLEWLDLASQVDAAVARAGAKHIQRITPWGTPVNDAGCLSEVVDDYPSERRDQVLRLFAN